MRWRLASVVLVLLVGCGAGETPTVSDSPTTVETTTSTATTAAGADPCIDDAPLFAPTWVPDEWLEPGRNLPAAVAGSGGDEAPTCAVFHWGAYGTGRFIDVRASDGGWSFGPLGSRSITVLGRPAAIGPIHEGLMVVTSDRWLFAYGVTEAELERFATGLYPVPRPPVAEEALTDGRHLALLVDLDEATATLDSIAWQPETDGGLANEPGDERLPRADGLVVTSPWARYGQDGCELCQRVIPADELEAILADTGHPQHGTVRAGPWWVTVFDGAVTRLDQQYTP